MDLGNLNEQYQMILAHMRRINYSEGYVRRTENMIKHILTLSDNINIQSYKDVYMEFVRQGKSVSSLRNYRALIGLVKNFDEQGILPNFINRHNLWNTSNYHSLIPCFRKFVDDFGSLAEKTSKKATTIQGEVRNASSFLMFMQKEGAATLTEISQEMVIAYFTDKNGWPNKSYGLKKHLSGIFKVASLLYPECERILSYIPKLKKRRKNIPYLTPEEMAAIKLALTDPDSPLSLRDRAIGLLAYETGLRCCDIAGLKLSSIDWESDLINIIQQKTDYPHSLRLPTHCGNAMYDYIKYERPKTDAPEIFVRKIPPYHRLKSGSLTGVAAKVAQAANIRQNPGDRRGFHLYRHRFATALLENNIQDVVISKAMGHTSPESLEAYLGADFVHLKENALNIEHYPVNLEVVMV